MQTDQGGSIPVTATLMHDSSSRGVTWTLNGPGTLASQTIASVTYMSPPHSNVTQSQTATITATSVADATKSASVQLTVNPWPAITTSGFQEGQTGTPYNETVNASCGTQPYSWSIVYGALPPGITLSPQNGVVSGTPTSPGTWYFNVQLTDAAGQIAQNPFLSLAVTTVDVSANPIPVVYQPLVPSAVAPGGPSFTLTVNGTGFSPTSAVDFNGTPLNTTFASASQLTAQVPANDIASPSTATITVVSPAPGGGRSNAVLLPIASPTASPNFVPAKGSPITGIYAPIAVAVGDFTGNGKSDLAIIQFGDHVYTYLGNGDGTFRPAPGSPIVTQQPPWDTFPTPYPDALALGDFNNSGKLGLAVAESQDANVNIYFGNGDGSFTPSTAFAYTAGQPVQSVVAADFRGNGNLDLAVANRLLGQAVNVLLGYQSGAFNQAPLPASGYLTGANTLAFGDFNADGKIDLAVATPNNTVAILLGKGDGTFTVSAVAPPVGKDPEAIAVADVNSDGKLDLVVANYQDNSISVLLGNGDGTFTGAPGSPITVGNGPQGVLLADLNNDGKLDIAVANYLDSTVTLLLGNGDGTFHPAASSPLSVAGGPYSLAAGDFDGSGRLGLVTTNFSSNTVAILLQQ
jgi:hypothetical protein